MDWYRGAERVASVSRLGKVFAPAFTEGIATGLNEAQFALYGAAMVRASISTTGMTATAFKAYLPSDASALKLWVESDKLTLADGANVLTWPDLSGNGDLISVGSAHPVYRSVLADPRDLSTGQPFADNGLPVVEWPRPNITPLRRMEGGTLNPQTHCVFCVVMPWYLERITGGNTIAHELVNALPLAGDDNGFAMSIPFGVPYHPLRGLFNSAGNSAMATGATTVYPPAAPKWILAEQEVNAANLVVKLDGVVQASAAINLPTIANDCTIRVGAAAMSNTQFGGYMRCVLVYEGALTGHQRTKIRNYLRRNYGPF
jgi:hypothetical protein